MISYMGRTASNQNTFTSCTHPLIHSPGDKRLWPGVVGNAHSRRWQCGVGKSAYKSTRANIYPFTIDTSFTCTFRETKVRFKILSPMPKPMLKQVKTFLGLIFMSVSISLLRQTFYNEAILCCLFCRIRVLKKNSSNQYSWKERAPGRHLDSLIVFI